ncbi:MAG: thiamine-phosphate kinase [Pyrinomonadaceae bacterium]|nr:thiamine-phosphate kinase [Pyrinomonadaceae bacterium]
MKTEFEFLAKLKNQYNLTKIGDDCAVLPKNSKTDTVITTDLLVEDIDFRLSWTKPEFLGHKSLAVSLSDIAAMGAKPVWSMLSIGVPPKIWKTDFVEKFYEGYMRLAKKSDVELVGGDVSKTPDKVVVDSIVAGEVKKGKAILRSGAKVGDLIYVTGFLGGASLGLELLENGKNFQNSKYKNLLLRQLSPDPQTEIGQILGSKNLATSMIDLSDGISSDLKHICSASRVGAKIFTKNLPVEPEIFNFESKLRDKISYTLDGGEDFELLFTVAPKKNFQLQKALKNHHFSQLGVITSNREIIELITASETSVLPSKGFQHFE